MLIVLKSGNPNLLEPLGPVQARNRTALNRGYTQPDVKGKDKGKVKVHLRTSHEWDYYIFTFNFKTELETRLVAEPFGT